VVLGLALTIASGLALTIAVLCFRYDTRELSPARGGPLLVVDRKGRPLRSVASPDGRPGREAWVPLHRVSSHALLTLLASEDQRFFEHAGVDPLGIGRAVWLTLTGRGRFGGSTITMQLMRMVHSAGQPRTPANKIKEIVLALRVERELDKHAILEQYLNRAYFGHGAYGIEAAARTYFDKPAASLSVGESTLLMVLVRGPSTYDPVRRLPRALQRRDHIFDLLVRQGRLGRAEVERARAQKLSPRVHRPEFRAPHFVDWVLSELPESVRRRGGVVRTTLDLDLQRRMQRRVTEHVGELEPYRVTQAGMVVLDTATSEVRAMVGSAGYRSGEGGQVNITTRRRHPGSALKPFVYAAAIEQGESPASVVYDIHDVPTSRYRVRHLTQQERGPVRFREALAGSYNLSAVHVLERVGVEKLMSTLRRGGVGQIEGRAQDYGLRLALGSAKVRLLDLAAGYGFLVRAGKVRRPSAVIEIRHHDGSVWRPAPARERRLFSAQTAWLVMDMLADPVARRPMFGQELPVDLPFRAAVKTGTARGFADTVAVAVTRELTVAAWAGNFDGRPTQGVLAMRAAAPLVRAGLLSLEKDLTLPPRPDGVVSAHVCPLSGKLAGPHCPHKKREHFVEGTVPRETCGWHQASGRGVTVVYPTEIAAWARRRRTAGGQAL
jgi:penicillin-binding protein 1C